MTTRCELTAAVFEAALDGSLTDDQRRHAETCDACQAGLAQVPRFDGQLRAAAQSLVTAPLPVTALEAGPAAGPRLGTESVLRLMAAAAIAGVVLLAAQSGYLRVGAPPAAAASPEATFRLHIVVRNYRPATELLEVRSGAGAGAVILEIPVAGCRIAYMAVPLGDAWSVVFNGQREAAGPSSPIAGEVRQDLSVRISRPIATTVVFDGVPEEASLDADALAGTVLSPCR
ncbi:MAG: hypothetical protein OEW24_00055 [Chloroflexota bacterium]|nr:hypothetical protein [Chloroflexota bacterium]